jgi:hypothetical protein
MTLLLINSLPNAILPSYNRNQMFTVGLTSWHPACAYKALKDGEFKSHVGHESAARLYERVLGLSHGTIEVNRTPASPSWVRGEIVLCGLFTPARRLSEGESWSEKDMLQMPINWVGLEYVVPEDMG